VILPHSESIEAEEDLIGDDLEDEIEGIGQTDADEDPEVLAGLLELSHLCELHAVKNTELELHHGIAGPAEVDGNDLNELEFPDDDALPDFEEVVVRDLDNFTPIDPSELPDSYNMWRV